MPKIGIGKIGCPKEKGLQTLLGTRYYGSIVAKEQTAKHSHQHNADDLQVRYIFQIFRAVALFHGRLWVDKGGAVTI